MNNWFYLTEKPNMFLVAELRTAFLPLSKMADF